VLFGHVVAAGAGTPVAGARVQAFSFEGLRLLAEQTTDGSGGFAFPETKDRTGAFHLVVRHPDFAPHVERWARAQAEPLSIALAAPSWIIGRLVFAEGESAPAPGSLRAFDRQPLSDGSTDVLGLDLAQMLPGELRVAAEFGGAGEGAFRLGPLRAGLYSVAYVSEGRPPLEVGSAKSYEPATGISVPRGETVDLGTVLLPATRRLVVRVVDAESHAPVLDATFVGVHEMDRARTAVPLLATPTGVPGEYALSSWPDPLTMDLGPVRVTAPGYGSAGANYPVNHYEGPPVARLARTGRLEGEVRNDAGEPLPGLVVLARLVVDGGLLGATTTDSGGRFALEALPALQEVDVVAVDRSARSLLAVAPVTLEPGRTLRVVLGGTDVTGVGGVITNAETPVAGAVISLDEPDGRRIQVQTAVDGRFAFVGLRTGRHELAAWIPVSDTFVKRVVDVEGGRVTDASVTLRNRLAGRLDVRTLDGERAELGTKASDVRVLAQPIEPKHTPSVEVPVQSDGTFALLLPNAALWRLSLEGKGAVVLEPPTVEMPRPADAPPVTLPVTLDPGDGTFALMVKDAESGALLPDATFHGEHGTWTSAGTIGDDATVREEDARIGHYEYAIGEDEHVTVLVGFDLTPTVRSVVRDVRLPRANGVRVTGFSGPANARAAGLEVGDVILRHGDARVENLRALRTAIDATKPADSVRVEIQRAGASVFLSLAGGRLGITAENVRVEAH
jgi:hypothetical protein